MTDAEIAAKLTKAQLEPYVHDAAIAWCGQKDRETFSEDITYFKENWWWASGMRSLVQQTAGLRIRALLKETNDE